MSQSSLIMPTVVLVTSHFSNSAEMLTFCGKGQIPWPVENWALQITNDGL